jgi:hypothetical protein
MIGDIIKLGTTIIDKIFPDKAQAEAAKIKLLELQQTGQLKELDGAYGAIIAEAKSQDKWTSRARPSFLYVIYLMIVTSIPMGVLYAYNPLVAGHIATGMKEWLAAIPNALWALFGTGYVGYSMSRSYDKSKLLNKAKHFFS